MNEIIEALIALLTAKLGSSYTYMHGLTDDKAKAKLPMIEVIPIETNFEIRGTGGLRRRFNDIEIKLTLNLKSYLKGNTNRTKIEHMEALEKIMEEPDTNGLPKSTTILGVVNDNLSMSSNVGIINNPHITYNENDYESSGGKVFAKMELITETILSTC